jgi:hypothetical protein
MEDVLARLQGGDRRSIGRSEEVVKLVLANRALFPAIVSGMLHDDPVVRMRASDVAEKVTRRVPELLQPYKREILRLIAAFPEKEVRWHTAQMLPRLKLAASERKTAYHLLLGYLKDESRIVRTFSMQALADLATQDRALLPEVLPLIERLTRSGTPAMTTRGRMLLKKLRMFP